MDLDPKPARRGPNALPRSVTLGVADTLDLVEPCDRIANMARVRDGLLALLREREPLGGQPLPLSRAQCFVRAGCHLMTSHLVEEPGP